MQEPVQFMRAPETSFFDLVPDPRGSELNGFAVKDCELSWCTGVLE